MRDDTELVKAAVQGMTEGTLAPFHQIVLNIFGPSSEALGRMMKQRVMRFEKRSKEMFEVAGDAPETLSPTLVIPIIQNGAVEENDELQDRWAALLVNCTTGDDALPGAPEILRQLTPPDVCFLQMCYDHVVGELEAASQEVLYISSIEVTEVFENWKTVIVEAYGISPHPSARHEPTPWILTQENVVRLGLVKEKAVRRPYRDHDDAALMMTVLGFRFIRLCQPPSR
jgi:hypothetical protein